jgi:hypothetical protein
MAHGFVAKPEADAGARLPARTGGAGAETPADRLLALQRTAGNRIVARLVESGRTLSRAPARTPQRRKGRGLKVTVKADHAMRGDDVGIAVLQQLYGDTPDQAARRLEEWKAEGYELSGPPFAKGVAKGDVFVVNVALPADDAGDVEQVRARAKDFGTVQADERRRINEEVDRRFWKKLGDQKRQKLGRGRDQQKERELWMRTRDEVLQERQRVLDLPDALQAFLEDGQGVAPENYRSALRIADLAKDFTDADWARYERNVGAASSDYEIVEESVRQFATRRAAERAIIARLQGTEAMFALWHLPSRPGSYYGKGWPKRSRRAESLLAQSAFKDRAEYDAACDAYLEKFRDRAVEITLFVLRTSAEVVNAELTRYGDAKEVESLFAEQEGLRSLVKRQGEAEQELLRKAGQLSASADSIEAVKEAKARLDAAKTDVAAERAREARTRPILKDEELSSESLDVGTAAKLGEVLRSDARARLRDIEKARARVIRDREAVFQFDHILPLALKELGAGEKPDKTVEHEVESLDVDIRLFGPIGEMIVGQHVRDIADDHELKALATIVLGIVLGVLTFGTGTVAVLAGGALLAQGVYLAAQEIKAYGEAFAAAHTAFDSTATLSGDSPSAFWAAFALIAAGFDGILLVNALRTAGKALRILDETSNFKRFDAQLLADLEALEDPTLKAALSPEVRAMLKRAVRARPKLEEAAKQLRRALAKGAGSPKVADAVAKCAYHAAQLGMKSFDEFVAFLKSAPLRPLDLGKLSQEELAALKTAWEAGIRQAEEARVAIEPLRARASEDAPLRPPVDARHATVAGLRRGVEEELAHLKTGEMPDPQWEEVRAQFGNLPRTDANLYVLERVERVYAGIRSPERNMDTIVDIWTRAGADQITTTDEVTRIVGGGRELKVTEEVLDAEPFGMTLREPLPRVDNAFKGSDHGAYTHIFQEILLRGVIEDPREFFKMLSYVTHPADYPGMVKPFWARLYEALFDSFVEGSINRPENFGPVLRDHLGLRVRPKRS